MRVWLLILLALMSIAPRVDAAARAFLDRSSISLGETVTLNVELDGMTGAEPDLTPLSANFRLLGTSSSSQLSLVNGRQTARQLWAVALEPLAEGVIGIPALKVGDVSTEPLTLTVLPAPAGASAGVGDDVFLEVEALPLDPYVQQQVRYVVRLHYAVNLAEGQLEEPQVEGARLQRLGSDARFQKRIADRRYEVIERRYALVPERSGRLQVSAPRFRGAAIDPARGGFFGGGRRLQADGDTVQLDVRPRPAASSTPWLPAQGLALEDESGALSGPFRVGEPITLALRLSARGLAADQLPELSLPVIEGAQVYPDLESSQTGDGGEWLSGERLRRFAIVPTRPGPLEIPAIGIDWWNVGEDRPARAEVAARRLQIGPAAAPAAVAPALPEPSGQLVLSPDRVAVGGVAPVWRTAALLLGPLWLATLLALLWIWRRGQPIAAVRAAVARSPRASHGAGVRRALEVGDLPELARQLRALTPAGDAVGLDALAAQLDDADQAAAVRALEQFLYGGGEPTRDSLLAQLRAAFRRPPRFRQAPAAGASLGALPPLYASSRSG